MVLFGRKWYYLGKSGCILGTWLYSGKSCNNRAQVGVLGTNWLYSVKVVVFKQKWLYSGTVVMFGQ